VYWRTWRGCRDSLTPSRLGTRIRTASGGKPAGLSPANATDRSVVTQSALLPRVPIASVLVEIDARAGFTDRLTHAGGKVTRPPDLRRNLLYVIIAEATNMGLGAMAESCGVPYDVLAWTAEWYFSAEALEAANAAIGRFMSTARLPV
jgi:Tn3 transposase DDE domain